MADPLIDLFEEWTTFHRADSGGNPDFARRISGRFMERISQDIIATFDGAEAGVEHRRGTADVYASGSLDETPLRVVLKLWGRQKKNVRNRLNEALAESVASRRAAADAINLDLIAVVPPRSAGEELSDEDLVRQAWTLLNVHEDLVGFDRVYLGFAGPISRWFKPGSLDPVPFDYAALLADIASTPAPAPAPRKAPRPGENPVVLLLGDEWSSSHGGISTFNRSLAIALAQRQFDVSMLLAEYTPDEADSASAVGIKLYAPDPIPGIDSRSALLSSTPLQNDYSPDLIIGHGRVLGPYAFAAQKVQFPAAKRLHIVHTDSESLEAVKDVAPGISRMMKASERKGIERDLAGSAQLVAGVGSLLTDMIADQLRGAHPRPSVFTLVPGMTEDAPQRLEPPKRGTLLVIGRAEDVESKGIDIAARAAALADRKLIGANGLHSLVIRGVQPADEIDLASRLRPYFDPARLFLRPYSSVEAELRSDLLEATTVLMPSRHEGFGLSAYEAIEANVPVLVSENSGLGKLIMEVDANAPEVLPVIGSEARVLERWAEAIHRNISQPDVAFGRAEELRQLIAAKYTWDLVVDAIRSRL